MCVFSACKWAHAHECYVQEGVRSLACVGVRVNTHARMCASVRAYLQDDPAAHVCTLSHKRGRFGALALAERDCRDACAHAHACCSTKQRREGGASGPQLHTTEKCMPCNAAMRSGRRVESVSR